MGWSVAGLVFGFLLGFYLVSFRPGTAPVSVQFVGSSEFEVWRTILAASVGIWIGSIPLQLRWLKRASKIAGTDARGFWAAAAVLLMVLGIVILVTWMTRGDNALPLDYANPRLLVIQLVGIGASGIAAIGLLIVGNGARAYPNSWTSPTDVNVHRVLSFRTFNRRFLALLGGFVGLSVLATGALRNAELAAGIEFPSENVILYGAFFTALVAAIYVPAFAAVEKLAGRILDTAFPIPTIGDGDQTPIDAVERLRHRDVYGNALQVGGTAKGNLEGVLMVLTPVLTALFASALGG